MVCAIYVTLAHISHIVFERYLGLLAFVVGTDWLGKRAFSGLPALGPRSVHQRVRLAIGYKINLWGSIAHVQCTPIKIQEGD